MELAETTRLDIFGILNPMIKYYGTPITPMSVFEKYMNGRSVLISFAAIQDFNRAKRICNNIIIDNGAFSFWRKNKEVDWGKYYLFVRQNIDHISYFIIPDVIDGTEEENNKLIADFFLNHYELKEKAIAVWHINESIERLKMLANSFDYIAFGSAGEYSTLGTLKWHKKMSMAFDAIEDENGKPTIKVHMLRCLNPDIFTMYPFHSGDSTSFAQNHKRDGADNILRRIESHNSPSKRLSGLFA